MSYTTEKKSEYNKKKRLYGGDYSVEQITYLLGTNPMENLAIKGQNAINCRNQAEQKLIRQFEKIGGDYMGGIVMLTIAGQADVIDSAQQKLENKEISEIDFRNQVIDAEKKSINSLSSEKGELNLNGVLNQSIVYSIKNLLHCSADVIKYIRWRNKF